MKFKFGIKEVVAIGIGTALFVALMQMEADFITHLCKQYCCKIMGRVPGCLNTLI